MRFGFARTARFDRVHDIFIVLKQGRRPGAIWSDWRALEFNFFCNVWQACLQHHFEQCFLHRY